MQLSDFTYELPDELIAKYPEAKRTDSKLLYVSCKNKIRDMIFREIIDLIKSGDLLILNNTKVIPARFYGQKPTGAKIEFLLERVIEHDRALVYIKANRGVKPGSIINLTEDYSVQVIKKQDNLYIVELIVKSNKKNISWYELLDSIGSLPLPPYINRKLNQEDSARYQTVFAKHQGAVAAPTAGLHFDQELLNKLQAKGVIIKYVTLHVGSGTFLPVREQNILEHKMHSENYSIEQDVIDSIIKLKNNNQKHNKNNRIIAVGTTSLRCLEAMASSVIKHKVDFENLDYNVLNTAKLTGDTDIFIYPGYQFKIIDSLITNFHLPGSTLMMLVSALIGLDKIKDCYNYAVKNNYRFFSYGDAMWLNKEEVN